MTNLATFSWLFRAVAAPFVLVGMAFGLSTTLPAAPIRMAVMGDSISAGSGVTGGSPNWVAQLTSTFPGAISFQNEATGGATTNDVVKDQLPTVVTLATSGQIDDSVVQVGANDMSLNDVENFAAGGNPTAFINSYVSDIETVINSVAAADPAVHQVFVNNPDPTTSPYFQELAELVGVTPAGLQLVRGVVAREDTLAGAYALAHNVAVVDIFTAIDTLSSNSPIMLAGQSFASPFAPDGHHPAPYVQGLLANSIDLAFNEKFGQTLPILSDQQIVQNVGLVPSGGTTFYNVQPFVQVPEPSTLMLASLGLIALVSCRWRRA
jgi:GDSL-like Lipase/Acylhydrolase family/PEP-CTERM motif